MPDGLFIFFAAPDPSGPPFLVLSRNAVTSAMGMILALVGVAADFFLLDAYFLGVLQVLVYAGAVMVLFLFIIMLLDTEDPQGDVSVEDRRARSRRLLPPRRLRPVALPLVGRRLAAKAGATPPSSRRTPPNSSPPPRRSADSFTPSTCSRSNSRASCSSSPSSASSR
jgi:hypothetical protein